MIRAGVHFRDALGVAHSVFPEAFCSEITAIHQQIDSGCSLRDAYSRSSLFPEFFTQIVSVGESSGNLEAAFERSAMVYEESFERKIKGLNMLIEPVLMIAIGLGVLGILAAIYLPLFEVARQF